MDLVNAYPNLPGVRTSTSFDWQKSVASSTKATSAVMIIGTARDGPSDPFRLPSVATGLLTYGQMTDAHNPTERRTHIARGLLEASEAGCNDIWVMRVGGTKASLNPTYTGAYLNLEALYAGLKYGDQYGTAGIGVAITENSVVIKGVDGAVSNFAFTDGVNTFGDLVDAINGQSLTLKARASMRGSTSADTIITSGKPAIITCANKEPYNVPSTTDHATSKLHFEYIDGDNNSAAGWDIIFPGTVGTTVNAVATPNMFCIMRGINDVISIRNTNMTAGIYENISVLDTGVNLQFFTGAELATQLQTKLNANATLTPTAGAVEENITVVFTQGFGFEIFMGSPFGVSGSSFTGLSGYSGVSAITGYSGHSGTGPAYGAMDICLQMSLSASTIARTLGFTTQPIIDIVLSSDTPAMYNVITNGNDTFTLSENGQYMRSVSVAPGYYTVDDDLVDAINAGILAAGGTTVVDCDGTEGIFTFSSVRYGTASAVAIANGRTTFLSSIGYDEDAVITAGTGFARFLDQATAKECADRITSSLVKLSALSAGTNSGNVLKIYSRLANDDGNIRTVDTASSALNTVFGIPATATTYSGQDGNLPVTLPSAMASTWSWVYMNGGDDGMDPTQDELLDLLADAYTQIEDLNGPRFIVPLGAYVFTDAFGNVNYKHAFNLARVCTIRSALSHFSHGICAVAPAINTNLTAVSDRAATISSWNFNMFYSTDYWKTSTDGVPVVAPQRDANGNQALVNMRNMVSIHAGPEGPFVQSGVGLYKGTCEAAYAGLVSGLSLSQAATNKTLPGITGLSYEYGTAAQNTLVGARFVINKVDSGTNIKIVSDVTYDYKGQTYDDLFTFCIMAYIVEQEVLLSEPYCGLAYNPQNVAALSSAIQKLLDGLKGSVLFDFDFNIKNPSGSSRMSDLYIEQNLYPVGQIKRIFVISKLSNTVSVGA